MGFLRGLFYLGCGGLLVLFSVVFLFNLLTSILGIRH
jgi:hypothetical protein